MVHGIHVQCHVHIHVHIVYSESLNSVEGHCITPIEMDSILCDTSISVYTNSHQHYDMG